LVLFAHKILFFQMGIDMSKIKFVSVSGLFATLFCCGLNIATAQTQSTNEIRGIGTGYAQDQFVVYAPVGAIKAAENPARCTDIDGYAAKIDFAGYKTHLSTVQLAFALGKPVTFTVSDKPGDCVADRPRIIGVAIYK
jgi:hypothetical protein